MKSLNYWSRYNKELLDLNDKITKYNEINNFNYVEDSFYNHIRDLLALTILKLRQNNTIKILDYGSNILTWSNLKNKINLDDVEISVFDPFHFTEYEQINNNIEIFSNLDFINKKNFDLSIFGSSSQYIEDLYKIFKSKKEILSKNVLFTHTPFSLSESFESFQFTGYKGRQFVRSIEQLMLFMKKENYELVFKSVIDKSFASVEKKYLEQTIYANILFSKCK